MSLDINKTYRAILEVARARKFISYGAIAEASGVPASSAHFVVPDHLWQLVKIGVQRDWPMLSAIVVNKDQLVTGTMKGPTLKGFVSAAKALGFQPDDPEAFLKAQQQAVFDWAPTAPEDLGLPVQPGAGPKFIRLFGPVLDALRALDGTAKPEEVQAALKATLKLSDAELTAKTKAGNLRFENQLGWARFYLAKAGLIDSTKRGVWVLTPAGQETSLDPAGALALFHKARQQFKSSDDDEQTAPDPAAAHDLFADPGRQFWLGGALWNGKDDQLARFLAEGIWQCGDDGSSEQIASMKAGDRIAIKSSFVQKYNLPFDVGGQPVSCMRIKATGTITANRGDGRTVDVAWDPVGPPRDWYFYTFRWTLVAIDPSNDLARRLLLFTFAGAPQDHHFWLTQVPYFAKKYGQAAANTVGAAAAILEDDDNSVDDGDQPLGYGLEDIGKDGCFLPLDQLAAMAQRLRTKRNIVLQGPPGTGKTWLAKRLGYALIGTADPRVLREQLQVVQFHPSLSYEDFVRGYRPSGDGKLALTDGVFLEMIEAAKARPDDPFVLVIEEINRGNPAQIFGELLTLLEDSKRSPGEAIALAYRRSTEERVYVPPNLHVIGTMNVADRSLALVGLALRRRFAFIDLEPRLNGKWRQWCQVRGLPDDLISTIQARMGELNADIATDRSLGPQYRVGHSYVTPGGSGSLAKPWQWFRQVVETEIAPLLAEYWFDAPDKARAAAKRLVETLGDDG